jgi:hypothetical protein
MDLVERYLYEVGRHLPNRQRKDIQDELRSAISDSLDHGDTSEPLSDDKIVEVLKEFGSPMQVAARYAGARSLIGPVLYPTYRLVLLVVIVFVFCGLLLGLAADALLAATFHLAMLDRLLAFYSDVFLDLLVSFGVVTLLFAVAERISEARRTRAKAGSIEWDPNSLPRVPSGHDRVSRIRPLLVTVFLLSGCILLYLYNTLMVYARPITHPGWEPRILTVPMLEYPLRYIEFWYIGLLLYIVVELMLFWRGRWDRRSRGMKIGAHVYSLLLLEVLREGPPLIVINHLDLASMDFFSNSYWDGSQWVLVGIMVLIFADLIRNIVLLVKEKKLARKT